MVSLVLNRYLDWISVGTPPVGKLNKAFKRGSQLWSGEFMSGLVARLQLAGGRTDEMAVQKSTPQDQVEMARLAR